ncbi:hypothetical protein GGC65_003136 [Sphingopyxis sp. OAS728]|uniref:hypothetical protein n=1 Tax=Sphingopyxis sp. OAS728 TaxID=2663823 RepID=UPI001788E956|nr:hypothetical protein [Sphingopyxis sp. OAS728]MBE1528680.1 hypothetical protein [Sphingopyxis sp. OAS728]
MPQQPAVRLWLSFGWIAIVTLWAWWEFSHYSGLYRWLAEWQTARWGSYEMAWTAIVPAIILMAPALSMLRRREQATQEALASGAANPADVMRGVRKVMLILGGISAVVAGGAYLTSQQLPDPSDPPAQIDLAALGEAAPPTGSAIFAGAVPDTDRALQMDEAFRSRSADIDHQTIYVPVVAKDAAKDAPVRFFIDRASYAFTDSGEAPRKNIFLADHMQGVLVEDGLPADVVAAFAKQGVPVASPHYLLTTNSVGGRQNHYIVAALGGFIAFILFLLSAVQSVSIARAERRRVDV